MPVADWVVFGGGRLGGAVARRVAAGGEGVLVASRTPRAHSGLWMAWDAAAPPDVALDGARVVIALSAPSAEAAALWETTVPRLARSAARQGAAAIVICGPAGAGEPAIDAFARGLDAVRATPRTTVLRFGPLFGVDDDFVWPLLSRLRASGSVRLPRRLPPVLPLSLEDAARAVVRLAEAGGVHTLRGPGPVDGAALGTSLTARFGGRWAWRWFGRPPAAARLACWSDLPDDWDDARLGPRQPLDAWVAALPGLRRKR